MRFGRRSYLKGCVVGLGSTLSVAGVAGAQSAEQNEQQYGTVIDVVEAGADDEGDESITPVLREHVDDDTLLTFPPGRYYMDEQLRFTGFENVGFVGEDATLVPATYHEFDGPQYRLFRMGTSNTPDGSSASRDSTSTRRRRTRGSASSVLWSRTVSSCGTSSSVASTTAGRGAGVVRHHTDPDGRGLVERFCAADGGLHVDDTPNAGNMWRGPTGIGVDPNHRGTLVFDGCVLGGFPGTGLYASNETGRIDVDGGRFRNSGTASIRLGGATGTIRDATIVVDENPHDSNGQHAIRLDHGDQFALEGISIDIPNRTATRSGS